jgi:hypothetical protein
VRCALLLLSLSLFLSLTLSLSLCSLSLSLALSLTLSLSVFFRPHTSDNKKIDIYDGDVLLVQSPGDDEE